LGKIVYYANRRFLSLFTENLVLAILFSMAPQSNKKSDDKAVSEPVKAKKPAAKFVDPILESRETIESFAVAIILALLFRAFIAEAFVIPTGSMAPTLMGRHIDTVCRECGYAYQASASAERNRDDSRTGVKVVDSRCPSCAYRQELDTKSFFSNDHSFSGDRIIVSKFAYEFAEPKRWDVIVFKFPEGAHQNYIKRLIGLPGETVKIVGGNIYTKTAEGTEYQIARKPNDKLLSLLQIVHDADHVAPQLAKCGWPARWQAVGESESWKIAEQGQSLALAKASQESWARYHHFEPIEEHWEMILKDEGAAALNDIEKAKWQGRLISDFYAYNCARQINTKHSGAYPFYGEESGGSSPASGQHWVDDLAIECTAQVKSSEGELLLDLVRGGVHYYCRIDVATGAAKLSIVNAHGEAEAFGETGSSVQEITAQTAVQGSGSYALRFTNVDHELRLWVNNTPVQWNAPAVYASPALILPDLVDGAQGDLAPVGLGGKNVEVTYEHLRVMRDKYYVALQQGEAYEYAKPPRSTVFNFSTFQEINFLLSFPRREDVIPLLESRQARVIELAQDQFMPLGDNSPASSDARYWHEPYVGRHLLVGRAVCIYWPHSWWNPWGWPNFERMKPIH
jgi:signal peptidase I